MVDFGPLPIMIARLPCSLAHIPGIFGDRRPAHDGQMSANQPVAGVKHGPVCEGGACDGGSGVDKAPTRSQGGRSMKAVCGAPGSTSNASASARLSWWLARSAWPCPFGHEPWGSHRGHCPRPGGDGFAGRLAKGETGRRPGAWQPDAARRGGGCGCGHADLSAHCDDP